MEEPQIRQRLLKVLCGASSLAIFISISILLVGVLIGPLWLIGLSVFVGVCSIFCIAYILSYKKIDEARQQLEAASSRYGVHAADSLHDVILAPPFCLHNMKLPSYEEFMEGKKSTRGGERNICCL